MDDSLAVFRIMIHINLRTDSHHSTRPMIQIPMSQVCVALLYVMLTDQSQAGKAWRDLTIVSRDNLVLVLGRITQLVSSSFEKLLMPVKMQLVWILEQILTRYSRL